MQREPWCGRAVAIVRQNWPSVTKEQWADRLMIGHCELAGFCNHGKIGEHYFVSLDMRVEVPGCIMSSAVDYHALDIARDAINAVPGVDQIEWIKAGAE